VESRRRILTPPGTAFSCGNSTAEAEGLKTKARSPRARTHESRASRRPLDFGANPAPRKARFDESFRFYVRGIAENFNRLPR